MGGGSHGEGGGPPKRKGGLLDAAGRGELGGAGSHAEGPSSGYLSGLFQDLVDGVHLARRRLLGRSCQSHHTQTHAAIATVQYTNLTATMISSVTTCMIRLDRRLTDCRSETTEYECFIS